MKPAAWMTLSLWTCCVLVSLAQSGMEVYPSGARSMGMGNSHTTLVDGYSLFNNIGALGRLESSQAFFGFDHRLNLSELTTLSAGMAMVTPKGNWGLNVSHFGGQLFNQQNVGLGFSNKLGIGSFGLKVNYLQTNMEEFGRSGVPIFEFGGVAELTPKLFFGAHIYNFSRAKMSKLTNDTFPTIIKAGLSIKPSEHLTFNVEAEKDILLPPILKVGMEYDFQEKLQGRMGFNSNPNNLFFGIGFRPRKYQIDYALSQNYKLGFTHHFSFNLLFGQ
ncbi:PorV/PorQ family protein [Litoribacter populi]|uniref:hypothetical protein n=1 Tax=Litoribacter populi TaxID=2598460 RepID=UPI001F1E7BFC|nr:hypothetical protein [Litoribacter populi]